MCGRCKDSDGRHLCPLSLFELLLCRLLLGSVSSGRGRVQLWFVFAAGGLHGDATLAGRVLMSVEEESRPVQVTNVALLRPHAAEHTASFLDLKDTFGTFELTLT